MRQNNYLMVNECLCKPSFWSIPLLNCNLFLTSYDLWFSNLAAKIQPIIIKNIEYKH